MEVNEINNKALAISKDTNYLDKDVVYLNNVRIDEWDIEAAGFSVIKYNKLLDEDIIESLNNIKDKFSRNVRIGKYMISNPEIPKSIHSTLSDVRVEFSKLNNIEGDNILSIKKDAMFLINTQINVTNINGYFNFRHKNSYTTYVLLNGKEFYYDSDNDILDTKKLYSEAVEKCEVILNDIKVILRNAEKMTRGELFRYLKRYRERYLERKLDKEAYRELETGYFNLGDYSYLDLPDDLVKDIDIRSNYVNYILPLIKILLNN